MATPSKIIHPPFSPGFFSCIWRTDGLDSHSVRWGKNIIDFATSVGTTYEGRQIGRNQYKLAVIDHPRDKCNSSLEVYKIATIACFLLKFPRATITGLILTFNLKLLIRSGENYVENNVKSGSVPFCL